MDPRVCLSKSKVLSLLLSSLESYLEHSSLVGTFMSGNLSNVDIRMPGFNILRS